MKKSSANLSTVERSMASGGRLSQCRRLGKYLNFRVKKKNWKQAEASICSTLFDEILRQRSRKAKIWCCQAFEYFIQNELLQDLINFYTDSFSFYRL